MNRFGQLLSVSIVAVAFSACGGGGGSSPAPSGTNTTPSTPSSPTTPTADNSYYGIKSIDGSQAGEAYVSNSGAYIYTFQGQEIDITSPGIQANSFINISSGGRELAIGGSSFSYARFGLVAPSADLSQTEIFYMGTKTTSMPTTGSAVYHGHCAQIDNDGVEYYIEADNDTTISFDVNYGNRTIIGTHDDTTLNGTIQGSDFAGSIAGPEIESGLFAGSFFGTNAQELAGLGELTTTDGDYHNFSFGAKK